MRELEKFKRPPVPIEAVNLLNLARLAMSRADVQPLFWSFEWKGRIILGHLSSIPYWRGNLPLFTYTYVEEEPKGYVAYTNLDREAAFFTDSTDDTRYLYGPVVQTEEEPELIAKALAEKKTLREKPLTVKAKDINSLIRVLIMMSDNVVSPPIWHYSAGKKHILGLIAPFFDYYEANALPVFFYIESKEGPPLPFIKYNAVNGREEISYADYVTDMRHFYGRIVTVHNIPFIRRERGGRKRKKRSTVSRVLSSRGP